MVFFDDGVAHPGHRPSRISASGEYVREPTRFAGSLTGRTALRLFVSRACPWAHRPALVVALKGLALGVTSVAAVRDDDVGWAFGDDPANGVEPAPGGEALLSELYLASDANYTGNITTPVLWDAEAGRIISNESRDIVRMLCSAYADQGPALVEDADLCDFVHSEVNMRVYQTGLGRSQEAYDGHVAALFAGLDRCEQLLGESRFLGGGQPSQADVLLWPTLLRFDEVYYTLFKCSASRIASPRFRNLHNYLRDFSQLPGVADTIFMDHIREHYFKCFASLHPKGTVPLAFGVREDLERPHDRNRFTVIPPAAAAGVAAEVAHAAAKRAAGEFVRGESKFRGAIDPARARAGHYVFVVANNCPWCHRVRLQLAIKGLLDAIDVDVVNFRRDEEGGWQYDESVPGCTANTTGVAGLRFVPELYERQGSTERSVPLLFDRERGEIVNNESADIVRALNEAFPDSGPDTYPLALRPEIDEINAFVYQEVNNGAYRAGFASNQEAYDAAATAYLAALGRLDGMLAERRFLTGSQVTEADVRLLPTMVRHDHVYVTRMRLPVLVREQHPHLYRWLRDMWRLPGVREATNLDHCVRGYFGRTANGIVPVGLSLEDPFP